MIPYGRHDLSNEDVAAVVRCLRSGVITQGPVVPAFESAVAQRVRARHAVAVNSGTSALHIACLALGLNSDAWLWTVPNTFVASANCGRYCGASIDFVDIDPSTGNVSVPRLKDKLMQAKGDGRLPTVFVPVHFAGQPTEQETIWALAKEFGFRVLEDACHAIGATRHDEPVGSCRWSDITVFSFHPVKNITTGEGGMALTNDSALAERMRLFRSSGITRDPECLQCAPRTVNASGLPSGVPGWYYEQQVLGYNYRMTDVEAALGLSQLERLDHQLDRRNLCAACYDRAFDGWPLRRLTVEAENRSAFHLYVVRVLDNTLGTHRRVYDELRGRGIGVNVHYMPVHLQPYYRELGFGPGQFPEAEAHGTSAITLPLFPMLTDEEQAHVIEAVGEAVGRA